MRRASLGAIGGLLLILFLVAFLISAALLQRQQQYRQHLLRDVQPSSIKTYPANIDYEVRGYGAYDSSVLNNAAISAVNINMSWTTVEHRQGVFNWAPADKEIAEWASYGKKFTLTVRYINQSDFTAGADCEVFQYLPPWETARIPFFCDTDKRILIPDYFDPTFKSDLRAYVAAIARHFATSPYKDNLLYVRVGVGLGGEGLPLLSCSKDCDYAQDKSRLEAWGYSPTGWKSWQEEMLSYFMSVFPYTTVIYPISQLEADPITGQPVQMEVAYWAAAHGLGVGQQGLRPGYPDNYAQVKTILSSIRAHYPNTFVQFRTVIPVGGLNQVRGDIATASRYGARSIEWYADDIANPTYQPLFQQWQQMVDSSS